MPRIEVRSYRPQDREAVRRLCADTGFLGQPIDPVFEDRELFADYLTGYYLRFEPDATLVCELNGEVVGYLMGCRRPLVYQAYQAVGNFVIAARALVRCYTRRYGTASRAFLRWIAFNAWREIPAAPRVTPHFHINLKPVARSVRQTRRMMESFLEMLYQAGHMRVCGQMVSFEARRTDALFERYGFQVLHRSEITKYRDVFPGRVFICTVVKDLTAGPRLAAVPRSARYSSNT
jgi:hypothetical protein